MHKIVDDQRMCIDLLEQQHVLLSHGTGFNLPSADHLRVVFLAPVDVLSRRHRRARRRSWRRTGSNAGLDLAPGGTLRLDAVKLLTIGEFARLARLSQKALRLYDELGLLRPFRVDEWSGYRYYAPSQLEQARLVAWLRRLGMPLAQIGAVVDAAPGRGRRRVAAFIRVTEADFAERQRLAQFLITYLREGASAGPLRPTPPRPPLAIRYAAASDIGRDQRPQPGRGLRRAPAGSPSPTGSGRRATGQARGRRRAPPARITRSRGDLLNVLSDAIDDGGRVGAPRSPSPTRSLADSGSTLTAMLLSGSRLALVHIGDTRAYLFRDGGLFQVTHDHSVTQSMIDTGRLTPEEAVSHPQRSLLVRASASSGVEREAGLPQARRRRRTCPCSTRGSATATCSCSDGLTAVVPARTIRETLAAPDLSPPKSSRG